MTFSLPLSIGLLFITVILVGLFLLASGQKKSKRLAAEANKAPAAPEKYQVAEALAAELSDNRLKCEMFVTIYSEQLHGFRNFDHRASYEDTGDFVHQYPPLSRIQFDTHQEYLALLGPRIAGAVADIYKNVSDNPEYIALTAGMPRDQAIGIIESVIENAEKTAAPIDAVIAGLNVIIRDSEKNRKLV